MSRFVVISLDNELGRTRRENINLGEPYIWSPGVLPQDVPEFVRRRWYHGRYKPERSDRLMGAFAAHLRAWELIAGMGSPAMTVLEDDARHVRPVDVLDGLDMPGDSITLLGGVFKGLGKWQGVEQRAYARGGFVAQLGAFHLGINELPVHEGRRMRWVMAVAYHLPAGVASKLVACVYAAQKRTLTTPDAWLNRFTTHFVWPPPFIDQDSPSQCMTPGDECGSDYYCDGRMQRILTRHFRKLN